MKVIVCFDETRITVPCGDGNLLVKDLVLEAISRYKRATGKGSKVRIRVHTVKSVNDGGILDFNDQIAAVVDDREQIMAVFEEDTDELDNQLASDGMSAGSSSTDTWRPDSENSEKHCHDVVMSSNKMPTLNENQRWHLERSGLMSEDDHSNGIEINEDVVPSKPGLALLVRRGSESALDDLKDPDGETEDSQQGLLKRWSTAAAVFGDGPEAGSGKTAVSLPGHKALPRILGSTGDLSPPDSGHSSYRSKDDHIISPNLSPLQNEEETVVSLIPRQGEPVGLHLIPEHDTKGLRIQAIDANSVAEKSGLLHLNDRIVDVNGRRVDGLDFSKAQDVLRSAVNAAQGSAVEIRVASAVASALSDKSQTTKRIPPPLPPKPKLPYDIETMIHRANHENAMDLEVGSNHIREPSSGGFYNFGSMRQTGRRLTIDLLKGPEGLGFTITTRDNPAGGVCPIFVKSILSKGAAYKDGRLKTGDRLLEVNSIDLTGKSQDEVVNMLRAIPYNTEVILVVGRPETLSPILPRVLERTSESLKIGGHEEAREKNKEIVVLDIPLNDSGSAGLGVRVKGRSGLNEDGHPRDEGIFVMNVIHGGAASKDGRLQPEDQLLNVNGISLLEQSNQDAMETLRKAMQAHGTSSTVMSITVARDLTGSNSELRQPSHMKLVNAEPLVLNHIIRVPGSPEIIPPKPPRLYQHPSGSMTSVTVSGGKIEPLLIEGDDSFSEIGPMNLSSGLMDGHGDELRDLALTSTSFDRDNFARQSMSEKRHTHIDPRTLKAYRDSKAALAQTRSAVKSHTPSPNHPPESDPNASVRRANSLESVIKGPTTGHASSNSSAGGNRRLRSSGSRNRACNESFRVAVDRSYEAEKDDDREGHSPANHSKDENIEIVETTSHESGKKATDKKKSGFLRGLLSRRSANKKGEEEPAATVTTTTTTSVVTSPGMVKSQSASFVQAAKLEPNGPNVKSRQKYIDEQQRIQVHVDRFKHLQQQQQQRQQFQPHLTAELRTPPRKITTEAMEQRATVVHVPNNVAGGRFPITHNSAPSGHVTSDPYGHYMNYDEIQRALKRRSDCPPLVQQRQRPVSNFFEYGPPPLPAPLPANVLRTNVRVNNNGIYSQVTRSPYRDPRMERLQGQENIYGVTNRRNSKLIPTPTAAAMMGSQV